MPTLASACGASLPQGVEIDGRDLLGLATGEAEASTDEPIFWQSAYYRVVRKGNWKLQVSERPHKVWLYDLSTDPTERVNLAQQRPDMVDSLKHLLEDHQSTARTPLYPYTMEGPVAVDSTLADKLRPGEEIVYWPN